MTGTDRTDDGPGEPTATTMTEPSPAAACEAIADAVDRDALVTVFGRCVVEYDGRARSRLGPGDRIVLCKPDGTVLVHTLEGGRPVNWQPAGAERNVATEAGELVLESVRSTPDERLIVRFERVVQVVAYEGTDETDLAVSGTEADLRRRILESPDVLEPGFKPLATERPTPAGLVDVYGEDAAGRSVVVELKRRRAGPDAVSQLRRYVDALERDLHADATVRGVLVAPSATDRAERLLADHGLEFVALEPTVE